MAFDPCYDLDVEVGCLKLSPRRDLFEVAISVKMSESEKNNAADGHTGLKMDGLRENIIFPPQNLCWLNHTHCMDLNSLYHDLCELEEVGHVVKVVLNGF